MKGLQYLKWRAADLLAQYNRKNFAIKFATIVNSPLFKKNSTNTIDADVFSFSSEKNLYEQLYSLLSFIKNCGCPNKWTVYSDGSHTSSSIKTIKNIASFVDVVLWSKGNKYKTELLDYATQSPMGKKLYVSCNHKFKDTAIYVDSDVLFFPQACNIIKNLILQNKNFFLRDNYFALDKNYLEINKCLDCSVNGGFFIINEKFDWSQAVNYIKSLNQEYSYFSEQTSLHISMMDNYAIMCDPSVFILSNKDQFAIKHCFDKNKIAIRHYVTPVRHKMWDNSRLIFNL
jgi:hypothetical protein